MSGAIPQRQIRLSIKLAQNSQTGQSSTFAGGLDSVDITGLRCSARIRNAYMGNATATVKVWGLPSSLMNQLSSLGMIMNDMPRNKVTISAGDDQNGMFIIFSGTIISAYGEYENQPDVGFTMDAQAPGIFDVVAAKPISYPQPFTVVSALTSIAQAMGMTLKNYGVDITLPPMYLSGSPAVQARKVAAAARVDIGYDDDSTMTLTPKKKGRDDADIEISPATGMISYPAFTQQGVLVKTIFDTRIKFKTPVKIQSSVLAAITQIKNAQGANYPSHWIVTKIDHDLDALVPKGQWMSTIWAMNPGKTDIAIPPAS